MNYPVVDILVATYNGEKYIGELLDSLLGQSYPEIRIFLLDDGSTDGTRGVVAPYVEKGVRILDNDHNLGYPFSFFELIKRCEPADFYCLCDQDDYWYPDKVTHMVERMADTDPDKLHLYFSAFEYADSDLDVVGRSDAPPAEISFHKTFFQCYLWGFSTAFNEAFRREFINNLPKRVEHEDYWFHMLCGAFGTFHYDDRIGAKHRRHGGNHSQDPQNFIRFQLWRLKYFLFGDKFGEYRVMLEEFFQMYETRLCPADRRALALFQSRGRRWKKAFYPARLRSTMLDELLLRLVFLAGKL